MFSWIHNCFSSGEKSRFDKARIDCTYPDWRAPEPISLQAILDAIKGKDDQISPQDALHNILSHLERQGDDKSAPYLLKNIYLLDRITSEYLELKKIATYTNSQLINLDPSISQNIPVIRDLITMYYSFVREKAKCFGSQSVQLREPATRSSLMRDLPTQGILNEINNCFKVQNMILSLSQKFKSGNKSSDLIQVIFCSLLCTYLFCYSIVSIAVRQFSSKWCNSLGRIPQLGYYDLEYLQKLTVFLTNQYTRNFLIFIEANKTINAFRNIKYNELNIVDHKLVDIIEAQIQKIKDKEVEIIFPNYNPQVFVETDLIEEKEEDSDDDQLAHKIKLQIDLSKSMRGLDGFFKYKNFYHEDFIIDEEPSPSPKQESPNKRKFGVKSKLSIYDGIKDAKDERQFALKKSYLMNREEWDGWQNIYSDVGIEKEEISMSA